MIPYEQKARLQPQNPGKELDAVQQSLLGSSVNIEEKRGALSSWTRNALPYARVGGQRHIPQQSIVVFVRYPHHRQAPLVWDARESWPPVPKNS